MPREEPKTFTFTEEEFLKKLGIIDRASDVLGIRCIYLNNRFVQAPEATESIRVVCNILVEEDL